MSKSNSHSPWGPGCGLGHAPASQTRRRAILRVMHTLAAMGAMPSRSVGRAERGYPVEAFDAIESTLACTLYLAPGAKPGVSVQAEPAVLDALRIRTEGNTLVLDASGYQTRQGVVVSVSFTALRRLQVSGSGELALVQLASSTLDVVLDGATDVSANRLNLGRLALDARGSDEVRLAGIARQFDLSLSGSGNVMANDLSSDVVEVRSTGSGDVQVKVKKQLVSRIEGSGSVRYTGRPTLKTQLVGSGALIDANGS